MPIEDGRLLAAVRRALLRAAAAVERASSAEARRAPLIRQIRCLTAIALLRRRELQQGPELRAELVAHGLRSPAAAIASLANLGDSGPHATAVVRLLPVLDRDGVHHLLSTAPRLDPTRWPLAAIARRLLAFDDVAEAQRCLLGDESLEDPVWRVHRVIDTLPAFPDAARPALVDAAWEAACRVTAPKKHSDVTLGVAMFAALAPCLDSARRAAALDRAAAMLAAWPDDQIFWDPSEDEEDPRLVLARARSADPAPPAPSGDAPRHEAERVAERVRRSIAALCAADEKDSYGLAYPLYREDLRALGELANHLSPTQASSALHAVWRDLRSTPHFPVTWWHLANCAVCLAIAAPREDRARFATELLAEAEAHPERTPGLHAIPGWDRICDESTQRAHLARAMARRVLPDTTSWIDALGRLAFVAAAEDRPRILDHQARLARALPANKRLDVLATIASAARGEQWRSLAAEIVELAQPTLISGGTGALAAVRALGRILDAAPSPDEKARIARIALATPPNVLNGWVWPEQIFDALPEPEADAEIARLRTIPGFRLVSLPRRLWPPVVPTPTTSPGKGVVAELPPAFALLRSPAELPALFALWPEARSYVWVIALVVARGWAAEHATLVRDCEDPSQRLLAWSRLWPDLDEATRATLESDIEIAARAEQGSSLLYRLAMIEHLSIATALRLWSIDGGLDADLHHREWNSLPWPGHTAEYLRALGGPPAIRAAADAMMDVLSWCTDPPVT